MYFQMPVHSKLLHTQFGTLSENPVLLHRNSSVFFQILLDTHLKIALPFYHSCLRLSYCVHSHQNLFRSIITHCSNFHKRKSFFFFSYFLQESALLFRIGIQKLLFGPANPQSAPNSARMCSRFCQLFVLFSSSLRGIIIRCKEL